MIAGVIAVQLCASTIVLADTTIETTERAEQEPSHTNRASQDLPEDLTEIGIQNLLDFDLVVTSPGKKKQTVSSTASAVYVLTTEDIRRSGATHIAEALRLVPGVSVARVSASKWAISVRGFNQVFSNKLLVLVDGISVFSPITNGVYWETNELPLEDVERVEVIRGPGAALWGGNAVNGVINIITKSTKDTKGLLASGGGGTQERGFGTVRYGGEIGENTDYRVYGRYADRADNRFATGGNGEDGWEIGSAGFRVDSKISEKDTLKFAGDGFDQSTEIRPFTPSLEPPYVDTTTFSGKEKWRGGVGNLVWDRSLGEESAIKLSSSYRYQELNSTIIELNYSLIDVDFDHRFSPATSHDVIYGVGFRNFSSETDGTFAEDFEPSDRTKNFVSWFAQDEIALLPDKLHLILGSKFEHNGWTGLEVMPNGRMIWTPTENESIWGAVSRAVAPPALVFEDVILPLAAVPGEDGAPTSLVTLFGSDKIKSETLLAYELGYRNQLSKKFSFDIAGFYNVYGDFYSIEPSTPYVGALTDQTDPSVIVPVEFDNKLSGHSVGFELAVDWRATEWMRIAAGYAYIDIGINRGDSNDIAAEALAEGGTPLNQLSMRTFIDLPHNVQLNILPRYIGSVKQGDISSYTELDAGISWRPIPKLELAVFGQNLLHESHDEFLGNLLGPPLTEIRRGVYGKLTYEY